MATNFTRKNNLLGKRRLRGFTMIELLTAIFILSIGICAVLIIFPLSTQVAQSSGNMTIGSQLAQEKIEEILSKSYSEVSIGSTTELSLPSPFSAFSRETRMTYVDPDLGLQETSTDKGIKRIEVTVSWKSSLVGAVKNIKIETLIAKK